MRRFPFSAHLFVGLAVAFAIVLAPRPLRAEAAGIHWQAGTLADALAQARASGRWVLVDVYATWCGPCHQLDEQVWSREDVAHAVDAEHGGPYVPLRRDGEQGEGATIVQKYHVVGYPTVLVLDGNGVEIDRLMGFMAPKELVATLAEFRTGKGTLADLERRLAASPGDLGLLLEVGTREAMRGDPRAVTALGEVAHKDPTGRRAASALLTLGKYYYLRGKKDYRSAISTLRELTSRFPSSDEAAEAPYDLGVAYHATGNDREARAVLDRWIAAAPKDVERYNAYAWMSFKNGFDRARGIEVARRGLEVDPKNDGLWDTLAELYAATGRAREAQDAESKALAIKPGDRYYLAQRRRFGGAK